MFQLETYKIIQYNMENMENLQIASRQFGNGFGNNQFVINLKSL